MEKSEKEETPDPEKPSKVINNGNYFKVIVIYCQICVHRENLYCCFSRSVIQKRQHNNFFYHCET